MRMSSQIEVKWVEDFNGQRDQMFCFVKSRGLKLLNVFLLLQRYENQTQSESDESDIEERTGKFRVRDSICF